MCSEFVLFLIIFLLENFPSFIKLLVIDDQYINRWLWITLSAFLFLVLLV